jgi:hypothetical protein
MKLLVVKFLQDEQRILYAHAKNTKIHWTSETTVEKYTSVAGWNRLEKPRPWRRK